ncbi:MAG: hypothetical protein KDB07_09080, partial [Planctomycetes bacterium]|nr:hypothetical protein [Planctomycetota bacterium]
DVPIFGGEGSIPDLDREVINPSELDEDERAERTAARRANYVMIRFIDVDNLRGVLAQPEEEASGGGR